MRTRFAVVTLSLAGLILPGQLLSAQQGDAGRQSGPWWAYSFFTPPAPGEAARECGDPPVSCANPRPVPQVEETPRSLPGAPRQYSRKQASEWFGPADWYPDDHPPMPDVVARGNEQTGVRACSLCHSPLGKGRSENASVVGLPVPYFIQQMAEFKNGNRRSADPRKLNTKEMIAMAKALSDEEVRAAAEYYGSMKFTSRLGRIVETDTVPKVRGLGSLFVPEEGGGTEPLGQRIIEVPENPDATEWLRDPKTRWIIYVPKGSVARGASLVNAGTATNPDGATTPGRTVQCGVCHGTDLRGIGNVPGIAGRSPSYLVRQLYDMQQGTRNSPMMKAVVANLTDDDFVTIGAHLASLEP